MDLQLNLAEQEERVKPLPLVMHRAQGNHVDVAEQHGKISERTNVSKFKRRGKHKELVYG